MAERWAEVADRFTLVLAVGLMLVALRAALPVAGALVRSLRWPHLPAVPLLAIAFALPTPPSSAARGERRPGLPLPGHVSPPPWSGPEGPTPPPLPVRAEGRLSAGEAVDPDTDTAPVVGRPRSSVHPAVHGSRSTEVVALFPREPRRSSLPPRELEARAEAIRRHPAGKALIRRAHGVDPGRAVLPAPSRGSENARRVPAERRYVVGPDDTLWDIAETHLGTTDIRRIARYWPLIHRANRALIGNNPGMIQPGWTLVLPEENP